MPLGVLGKLSTRDSSILRFVERGQGVAKPWGIGFPSPSGVFILKDG